MIIDNEKIDAVFNKLSKFHYSSMTTFNQEEKDVLSFMERLKIVIIDKDKAPEHTWITLDIFGYKILSQNGWINYLNQRNGQKIVYKLIPIFATVIGTLMGYLLSCKK